MTGDRSAALAVIAWIRRLLRKFHFPRNVLREVTTTKGQDVRYFPVKCITNRDFAEPSP